MLAEARRATIGRLVVVMITMVVSGVGIWMLSLASAAPSAKGLRPEDPIRLRVEVLEEYPHDRDAYTQGLLWDGGFLFESTGEYGKSSVRRVHRDTGEVVESRDLPHDMFGEGLARIEDQLIQLTWQEQVAMVWSREGFRELARHAYQGEGWGLCFDGRHLVMSDGSSALTFRDPETFDVVRQIVVTMGEGAVGRLNELECVGDRIYANVYTTEWIVRIDAESGRVDALIDASGLLAASDAGGVDVLNGIAYDPGSDVFYLTGKLWPKLFAVRFIEDS